MSHPLSGINATNVINVTNGINVTNVTNVTNAARPGRRHRPSRGFTLIELMIVVAVAGVLSSVAYPSFQSQVQKARRADALLSLMQVQMAQERWRSNSAAYGSLGDIGVAGTSTGGHYTLQVLTHTPARYAVLATATGTQARDSNCRHLVLSVDGAQIGYASGADAAVDNGAALNRACWNL